MSYTEWLCHTNFSFLTGASHPHELLDRAAELGLSGLAINDFDGVYGLARSYVHWRDMDQTTRPALFYGAELHLSQDHDLPIILQNTITLIARNLTGYQNLCKIITHCHRNGKYNSFITIEDLSLQSREGLSAILPMRGLMRRGAPHLQTWQNQLRILKDLFPKDLFLAVSRHINPTEDVWIPMQMEAAKGIDAKILLSQDVFFHDPSRKPLSDSLHAIRTNNTLPQCIEHMFINDQRTLLSPQNFHNRYKDLPCYQEALKASEDLAASCHFSLKELSYHYPKEMIPPGHTAQSYLHELTWQGAHRIYSTVLPHKVQKLIEHELKLIEHLGFADYFLTVWDIVHWARQQKILYQGRGSAANSAVCFVLGITAVDPTNFDLLFERFMSAERGDPPDIDVDFEHERREEVIQYIYRRYGRDKSAMVANVITFRSKGSLREIGKVLGIPSSILSEASDLIRSRVHAGKSMSEMVSELEAQHDDSYDIPWSLWIRLSKELKGFPRHLGIHSGGFMISDRTIHTLVPCEPATMEGRTVIQWCKDDIEELGFFKIDILALGMLTAIRKMFALIAKHQQKSLSMSNIPQEDPSTYQMIRQADTIGTFQIESRAQMSMLPRLLPRTFYDLVIEVAIVRPGPIQGGMIHPFLRRRNGEEAITYPDERLRPILHRTLGIPIFQEQVMRIAMAVGNFTPGEANELRKNMGAWSMRGDINPWLTKLAEGLRINNISPEFSEAILAQMKGFAEYGFPESHSVSFALIAYVSSYLKCHYPAAFFAGLLNSQPMGFYSPHALLQASKRSGLTILPITANHSNWDCTLEPIQRGDNVELAIRLGTRLISGFREQAAKHLQQAREKSGPWTSWQNFLENTHLLRSDLTTLAAANAFQSFGLDRRSAIWMAAAAPHSSWLEDVEDPLHLPQETIQESVQQDFNATGTSLVAHPAQVIRETAWCYSVAKNKLKSASDIDTLIPNQTIHVFGMIMIKQRPPSAKGMMFITLEDETGLINIVFKPDVTERFSQILTGQSMLCVSGKLQRQNLAHSVLVREVFSPQTPMADVIPFPTIPVDTSSSRLAPRPILAQNLSLARPL